MLLSSASDGQESLFTRHIADHSLITITRVGERVVIQANVAVDMHRLPGETAVAQYILPVALYETMSSELLNRHTARVLYQARTDAAISRTERFPLHCDAVRKALTPALDDYECCDACHDQAEDTGNDWTLHHVVLNDRRHALVCCSVERELIATEAASRPTA